VEARGGQHVFEVQVYLDDLSPDALQVELYADPTGDGQPIRQAMERGRELLGSQGGYTYSASVAATRPASDYTARVVPYHAGALVPLEASQILWQR
jgi:glycogen phosphorylase